MKHVLAMCCLLALIGCSSQNSLVGGEPMIGEFETDQLIDAFMSYTQKAEGVTLSDAQKADWLNALQGVRDDLLLVPYPYEGEKYDRNALMDEIAKDKAKLLASEITVAKREKYAFEPSNLEGLTEAELVIAFRLVRQAADKIE